MQCGDAGNENLLSLSLQGVDIWEKKEYISLSMITCLNPEESSTKVSDKINELIRSVDA